MAAEEESREPLERIYYTDGQRLSEELLRKEQDYHVRIQRLLSKSLFTAGVADGLEVTLEGQTVVVSPGVALDEQGRALVLLEPRRLDVVDGRYLTIAFGERAVRETADGCRVAPLAAGGRTQPTAWRGPSLYRLDPVLAFRNRPPADDKLELILAELEFDQNCVVSGISPRPPRYATATGFAHIRTFAFEGEKDIDPSNPKRVYFHIRGRNPTAVVLYLRADAVKSMFYDVPTHTHDIGDATFTVTQASPRRIKAGHADGIDSHAHDITHKHGADPKARAPVRSGFVSGPLENYLNTGPLADDWTAVAWVGTMTGSLSVPGAVSPGYGVAAGAIVAGFGVAFPGSASLQSLSTLVGMQLNIGNPVDSTSGSSLANSGADIKSAAAESARHSHTLPGVTEPTGAAAPATGNVDRLYVALGTPEHPQGIDITGDILEQLTQDGAANEWAATGGGISWERLSRALDVAAEIRLDEIRSIGGGEHWVELSLQPLDAAASTARKSGRIYYNLYVEAE